MRFLMLLVIGACSLVLCSAAAAEPRVSYKLACYAPATSTSIEAVKAGEEFDLALIARDLRPDGEQNDRPFMRGVFAGYVNVSFPARYAAFRWVEYQEPYTNGKRTLIGPPGLARWGGTGGLSPLSGRESVEISRCRLRAQWPATMHPSISVATMLFKPNLVGLRVPHDNTLLYGNTWATPPDYGTAFGSEIQASGILLRILK